MTTYPHPTTVYVGLSDASGAELAAPGYVRRQVQILLIDEQTARLTGTFHTAEMGIAQTVHGLLFFWTAKAAQPFGGRPIGPVTLWAGDTLVVSPKPDDDAGDVIIEERP